MTMKILEDKVPANVRPKIPDPIWVEVESGCWEWQGYRDGDGYGLADPRHYVDDDFPRNVRTNGQHRALAHRISYWQNVGPIPDGLVVRHTCDNPPCVNPAHLRVGTRADNQRDMYLRGRRLKDFCPKGHDRSPENLIYRQSSLVDGTPTIRRTCKICRRERDAEYRARKRGGT